MVAKIKDIDMGLKRIAADIKELGGYEVHVGLHGSETYEGTSVIDIGMYNEFGTSRGIPARPFMSRTYDEQVNNAVTFAKHLAGGVIDRKISVTKALTDLGMWYQSEVQKTIRNAKTWAIPNAPGTIKAKGSSSPLIDTGRMVGAVRYEIVKH
jgi:hypothetical protein